MRPQTFDCIQAIDHLVNNAAITIEVIQDSMWVLAPHVQIDDARIFNLGINKVYRQNIDGQMGGLGAVTIEVTDVDHKMHPIRVPCFLTRELTNDELNVLTEDSPTIESKRTLWAGYKNKFVGLIPIESELELLTLLHT